MMGPASPWHITARQRPRYGNTSEKSVPFSDPPRIRTTGSSKLVSAATTAAGLVAFESSTYFTPPRSPATCILCGFTRYPSSPARTSSSLAPSLPAAAAAKRAFSWLCGPTKGISAVSARNSPRTTRRPPSTSVSPSPTTSVSATSSLATARPTETTHKGAPGIPPVGAGDARRGEHAGEHVDGGRLAVRPDHGGDLHSRPQ